jgi:hypothetical protein
MIKNLAAVTALLLCMTSLYAQDLSKYTWYEATPVTFSYPCGTLSNILTGCSDLENLTKTEVPPWIIGGGWRTYFLVDGIHGAAASSPADMINNTEINFKDNGGDPVIVTSPIGCPSYGNNPWRQNYYAVYSAQYFNHPTLGPVSLGYIHAENRTMVGINQPAVSCSNDQFYGYGGFVCAGYSPNNQSTNWGQQYFTDLGPIIWPSMGYFLPNGQKCSGGVRHPSSIQADDGYIYVFYKDESNYVVQPYPGYAGDPSFTVPEGHDGGNKVARVPVADALNPQAYQSFYEDALGNQSWNPSLPAGFNLQSYPAYLNTMGPQASDIMKDGYVYIRFSAAKVAGTNYYYGVGAYSDPAAGDSVKVCLRWSYDLVHWHDRVVINTAANWSATNFDYPIFLSTDGWSNTSIDPSDFYVVGTNNANKIDNVTHKIHVYIPPPPSTDPPPGNGGGTTCDDGHGNTVDCTTKIRQKQADELAGTILDMGDSRAPYVYPNPGHGMYTLNYTLKDHAITQLNVLDLTGRKVQTGATSMRAPGSYTETVNISGRAKGIYFLELLVNGGKKTFKVIYQ